MADWRIILEDKDFPKFPADEPQPSPRSSFWRWSLLIGSMAITVLIFGFFTLQERQKGQVAVRENLTALIIHEELLRLTGNRPQAESLIAPDAPQAWRNAYWDVFEDDNLLSAAGDIHLNKIDFEGRCAVVEVDIYGSKQVRAYCLNDRRWQRAPVPRGAWGYGQTTINFPNGASLHFFPRDQVFAEALSSDLLKFFEAITSVLGEQPVYKGLEIRIEPHDLRAPLVLDDEQRIIVNSPWLLPTKGETVRNSSGAMVHLVLAKALLRRTNPVSTELPSNLPGVVRFLEAAQTIGALHLMPPLEPWRIAHDKGWISTVSPYSPSQRDSFYLMANDIYHQCGLQTLMDIVQRLPNTSSWDDVYQRPLNHSSFILDNEVVSGGVQIDPGQVSMVRDICSIESDNE